jgi:hypothetical protein
MLEQARRVHGHTEKVTCQVEVRHLNNAGEKRNENTAELEDLSTAFPSTTLGAGGMTEQEEEKPKSTGRNACATKSKRAA